MARVLLLAGPGRSTWVLANALTAAGHDLTVMVEERVPRLGFLWRRMRKFGPVTTIGQVLFQLYAMIAARHARVRARVSAIYDAAGLDDAPWKQARYLRIASANSAEVVSLIEEERTEVVVVNGTRILAHWLIDAIEVPILNIHAGITPAYRGVHGGYWALALGDPERCGVTVHLVDDGVDTGEIISQAPVAPERIDSYVTYPALQLAAGVPLLLAAVDAVQSGRLTTRPALGESRQHYHPTLWGYIAAGLRSGVW